MWWLQIENILSKSHVLDRHDPHTIFSFFVRKNCWETLHSNRIDQKVFMTIRRIRDEGQDDQKRRDISIQINYFSRSIFLTVFMIIIDDNRYHCVFLDFVSMKDCQWTWSYFPTICKRCVNDDKFHHLDRNVDMHIWNMRCSMWFKVQSMIDDIQVFIMERDRTPWLDRSTMQTMCDMTWKNPHICLKDIKLNSKTDHVSPDHN